VRRDFALLSAVLATARREWRWINDSPLADVRKPPAGKPRTRLPTWREIRAICRGCGYVTGQPPVTITGQVAYVLLISLRTAMRRGEILGLKAGDIDVTKRLAVLELTKNGDRREVPLSRKALRLIRPLLPGWLTVQPASLDALWRKVCGRVGVDGLHLHDARAAALTSMARKVDVLTLARISGHRDIKQLMTYYRETPGQIADRL
jgi:integrase